MSFCVLVASSDNRKDIFDVCFANSEHIWKDCDWPRFVGFNSPHPDQHGFSVVTAVPSGNWCEEVAQYVDALPAHVQYILLMVEDVLFMRPVNADKLNEVAHYIWSGGLHYVRLVPVRRNWLGRMWERGSDNKIRLPMPFHVINPREPYYSSTEMVIWERNYLREQLDKPGDAWSFEHHVSRHAHWAVWETVFDQHQIVNKGYWNRRAPWYLAESVGCPTFRYAGIIKGSITQTRPLQRWSSFLRGEMQNLNFALFGFTSFRVKRWLGF